MGSPSSIATTAGGTRPRYELADIVRRYGARYRHTHMVSGPQEVVLRALARCRTAALGGHVEACDACGATRIAYNSCRNRHCPKCQGGARLKWLAAQHARLLPVPYFHLVFTLPHELNALLRVNPRRLYALLFRAAAATLQTFSRDDRHLGAELGVTAVLHTWGQNLTQHVHVHCVVTGGGLSPDGRRWVSSRPGFLFPVRALSRVFRGKFLAGLRRLRTRQTLRFAGECAALAESAAWTRWLQTLRTCDWVVYAKPPFGGPERVLHYLSRYTHRVAIANSRLVAFEAGRVSFKWKDYRREGQDRYGLMTLDGDEFIRRFLLHVLPNGFHRIRHYGLFANTARADNIARARRLLDAAPPAPPTEPEAAPVPKQCPCCGGRLILTEAFERGRAPQRHSTQMRCDTS